MVYKMSQREIDLRAMANAKAARLNSMPRPAVDRPALVAADKVVEATKPPTKRARKKKSAKKRRK